MNGHQRPQQRQVAKVESLQESHGGNVELKKLQMTDKSVKLLLAMTNKLRGIADVIDRRQPRPTPKQRRLWANTIWEVSDMIDTRIAEEKNND